MSAFPDKGLPEEYTEAEMMALVKQFDTDKSNLTKLQKAAVARYNFKKGKGEAIAFRKEGEAAAAPAAAPAAAAAAAAPPPPKPDPLAEQRRKDRERARETPLAQAVAAQFGDAVDFGWQTKYPYVIVKDASRLPEVAAWLRDAKRFRFFVHMTAVDYPPDRIECVYNLYDTDAHAGVALKVALPRAPPEGLPSVPSLAGVFRGANWYEREVYDLFGVRFEGHPYLKRIMMPEGWVGHPMRKDYDVTKEQYIALGADGEDIVSWKEEEGW